MRSRVAYVVLAHKHPRQVARLVRRLATDRARFLVHLDRRAGPSVERELRGALDGVARVRFLRRRRCYWGGFGMVGATLEALATLVGGDEPFDHVLLLSGQDYPLRPAEEVERFLGANLERSFMTASPVDEAWPGTGRQRIERWHLVSPLVLHVRLPWRRRVPRGLAPWGGGAWICLSRPAAELVHELVRTQRDVLRFFQHALHPDELLFQTIVMNSHLADTVVRDHLRYIDWSRDPAPATLGATDLPALLASGKLLARKFDVAVDESILDLLDAHSERETVATAG
ncbi:MAG TPA: beta-1,6-N-acetylglucosaminyltransferase [Gaiellaceae bacterium]|nr:beta-1,6-N-acetylglucosaminyltransferase [Gaiellaceae bacterium]